MESVEWRVIWSVELWQREIIREWEVGGSAFVTSVGNERRSVGEMIVEL